MSLNMSSETQKKIQTGVDFPQFDVVSDPSDHHYFHSTTKKDITGRQLNKIMKEWKILERHLPDSIFVRVYEDRVDLMRAIIVGAAGTPYHDGLYLFDIFFPPNYPVQPPLVYYKSFGFRINPNLYEDGLICLSLLNTWPGGKRETWNTQESTILQVLVSIQALVLNEKPFFNEAGYDKLLERRHVILSACMAYANGEARIGHYNSSSSSSSPSSTCEGKFSLWLWICDWSSYFMSASTSSTSFGVSKTFKESIHQLEKQFSVAFKKNEASLKTLIKQLKAEKKNKTKSTPTEKKKKIETTRLFVW
ncbi:Ubiquitin-conjugating enzyme family protein [Euphorbia peplus]|nr:Ubiquitin-conjugating enzyme family protein [Euphorbia peplus]